MSAIDEVRTLSERVLRLQKDKVKLIDENNQLRKELEEGKKRWAYYEARFVECNTCSPEDKEKCLMFSEMLCEGDRCKTLIDLEQLINIEDDLK